jgi:hypothetical protein
MNKGEFMEVCNFSLDSSVVSHPYRFQYRPKLWSATYFLKIAVFWVIAPCSLVEVHHLFTHHPDDGGSTDL